MNTRTNFQNDNRQNAFLRQPLEDDDNLLNSQSNFGPLELNILERVENGLDDNQEGDDDYDQNIEDKNKGVYEGNKEIVFVQGWVDVNSIYNQYLWSFIQKILIGISLIYCIQYGNQDFTPTAIIFCVINLINLFKNLFLLIKFKNSDFSLKIVYLIDFHISLSYFIYFSGFYLVLTHKITYQYFLLFSLPFLIISLLLFFYNSDTSFYLSQKKFFIFEALQLLLISFKFSQLSFINWDYTLIFYMAASIYLTVLGMLLTIVLSCAIFGFLYNNMSQYKIKSLFWLTWYYVWNGVVYIYLIKGVIQFYNEDDFQIHKIIQDYTRYKSDSYQILIITSYFMIVFAFTHLILHLLWKKELKMYFQKVIFKNELRREISIRRFSKDFMFPLDQISDFYFSKKKIQEENFQVKEIPEQSIADKNILKQICVICYEDEPNILFEPCNHGAICKDCFVSNVKHNNLDKIECPFCKSEVKRIFLMEFDQENQTHIVKGEIKLKS